LNEILFFQIEPQGVKKSHYIAAEIVWILSFDASEKK